MQKLFKVEVLTLSGPVLEGHFVSQTARGAAKKAIHQLQSRDGGWDETEAIQADSEIVHPDRRKADGSIFFVAFRSQESLDVEVHTTEIPLDLLYDTGLTGEAKELLA